MGHESWMFYSGIALLSSFLPLTACSYRFVRFQKKHEEQARIMKIMQQNSIEDSFTRSLETSHVSALDYSLPLLFVTVFSVLGFFVLFTHKADILLAGIHYAETGHGGFDYVKRSMIAIGMAFLGTYLWSVQYIFRRLVTNDLPPAAFYSVGLRMIVGSFVALVFHHFISFLPSGALSRCPCW